METMSTHTRFTKHIISTGQLNKAPLNLVDVGASGGIDAKWSLFGKDFRAYGFDPLVKECERLNAIEQQGCVEYIPAFVGAPVGYDFPTSWQAKHGFMNRLSVTLANQRLNSSANERYNAFQKVVMANDHITLDDFFDPNTTKLDFLKIDTDGYDIEVLYGAEKLFAANNFLGACIECQFHGPTQTEANTFANIDIFMRQRGFSLFDMEIHRYSRKALPGKFLISIPAQTDIGQVQWADVIYFRDLGNRNYTRTWGGNWSPIQIVKLACLFELHRLNDCAVELLTAYRDYLSGVVDIEAAIELLVPPLDGRLATHDDYLRRFEQTIEEMRLVQEGDLKRLSIDEKRQLKAYHRVALFGAGGRLTEAYQDIKSLLGPDIEIRIIDNDKNKWGRSVCGEEVVSPEHIKKYRPDIVIIVSTFVREILSQLVRVKKKHSLAFKIACY